MDARTKSDLQKIAQQRAPIDPLAPASAPVGIPAKTGSGDIVSASGTAGIASPLIENSYEAREWFSPTTLTSSDGLLSFSIRRVKTVAMTDSKGASVVLKFKEPA